MASGGPRVTLTFAGDTSNLEKSTKRATDSTEQLGESVGRSGDRAREAGGRYDRLSEGFDTTDTRAMGFRDTLTGLEDGFAAATDSSASMTERLLLVGFAVGDTASGFVNFLLPAMKSAWTGITTRMVPALVAMAATAKGAVLTSLTSVASFLKVGLMSALSMIAAHPIIFALIALAGIFVLLWTNSETFRDIVTAVFNAVWGVVQAVAGWIWGRMVALWDGITGAAQAMGGALSSIWDALMSGGRSAVNFVISMLNGAIRALNSLVSGINRVPGVNIPSIPTIPHFHTGGRVGGAPGTEQLAMLQAGERVTPASIANREDRQGSNPTVTFRGNTDTAVATMIMRLIRSGDLQIG